MTVEYTAAQCMAEGVLPPTPGKCKGCGADILWGVTTTGRNAPFDAAAPHPNHFITCPDRERFKEKKR